ncbi:DUF2092 domain-containing protein [Leptolyngbya sp. 7M]|uniref:DUF2092 domain-containing protein n=1 Tax=Leptolyngbya sp. 7M TaxID=2812896 RepID=UPI001B8D0100|nr:DUF2092 domain-containing protein [Leptolyngbya sp. 7M]QYO64950.1 DUF2092 domain-containing protein [Leptolyngbya sp. 7M]
MNKIKLISQTGWRWVILAIALSVGLAAKPVASADSIDPDADQILRSMSSYLAQTQALSVNADVDFEILTRNGQKLQFSSYATLLQRPDRLHIQRRGSVVDADLFFDGKTLTLLGRRINAFAQRAISGTIDDAILAFERETGLPAPGADLLFADPYATLSSGVASSTYLGTAYVNGIEVHHLAFREADVDWQLWVQTGDQPLPMKYVITTKWMTAAPQYEIRLRDWNTNPQIAEEQFVFSAPVGTRQLETLPANELDEFPSMEEEQ